MNVQVCRLLVSLSGPGSHFATLRLILDEEVTAGRRLGSSLFVSRPVPPVAEPLQASGRTLPGQRDDNLPFIRSLLSVFNGSEAIHHRNRRRGRHHLRDENITLAHNNSNKTASPCQGLVEIELSIGPPSACPL